MKARHDFKTDAKYKTYLKTYFAAIAMQGILANSKLCSPKNFHRSCMCEDAITMADELLKQLS